MSTGRKLISDVRGRHKLLSSSALINDRVVLSEIRNKTLLLVKRETNLRKLWATDTIFSTIPCLEMKEVSTSECTSYSDPCTIARSVNKIPRIAEGNYQYVIQGVYSINAMSGKGKKLKEVTINRYMNLLKLPIIKKEEYFWINDDYLYASNPFIQAVRISAMFEQDIPNDIMYSECNCANPTVPTDDYCKNPLDKQFPLPGYLTEQVMQLTSQTLLETYFSLKSDISQDGIDGQAPNVPNSR